MLAQRRCCLDVCLSFMVIALAVAEPAVARAQSADSAFYARYPWAPRLVAAQFTYIGQDMSPFAAPSSGTNSLTNRGDHQNTHTYGVDLGARITTDLQIYADVEMARGAGIGHAVGLAGLTDGDVIRQGIVQLGQGPYLARSFVRYLVPMGPERDTTPRAADQVPAIEPATRIEIKAGKWAINDELDVNRYAGSTRYQFMDWGLWANTAWDFAANTRGYTNAVLLAYVSPRWAMRFAAAQMPTFANSNVLDNHLANAYGLNAELTVNPIASGPVVRLLAFENRARMGIYRDALRLAAAGDTTPNIGADDRTGRVKYGFGLNVEQPLADSGNTGLFLRLGWNDGKTEDFVFTESDRHLSGGIQIAGALWSRGADRLGIADVVDGLSEDHRDYLAAGGLGFLLGDGSLRRYGPENVVELYYRLATPLLAFLEITPAIQHITDPGYDEDRGPVWVYTIRVNLHY